MTLDDLSEFQQRSLRSILTQTVNRYVREPVIDHTLDQINIDLTRAFDKWKRRIPFGEELEVYPVAEFIGRTLNVQFRRNVHSAQRGLSSS